MAQQAITHSINIEGKEIILETGKLATQADGSIVLKCGKTMLLATVVSSPEAKDGVDFLPLTVDYREKFSAAGRYPGGFLKREARPSDDEILVSRLIDRAVRPLFPKDYHAEIQLLISLISVDPEIAPDALACFAASAAIAVSDLPMIEPVSEVRVAKIDGKFEINPNWSDLEGADIDMIIAGTKENIMMVEGELSEQSEQDMIEAIKVAHKAIQTQCDAQVELAKKVSMWGVKRDYSHERDDESFLAKIKDFAYEKCYAVAESGNPSKDARKEAFGAIKEELKASLSEEELEENGDLLSKYFHKVEKEAVRNALLDKGSRLDGRKTTEIRPIWSEVNYLPVPHGSAIFTRGETQSLSTVTLGSKLDEKYIDGAFLQGKSRFLLHYNFPPFSTGEARPMRGTSRREIGHGNLALRALKRVLPEDYPYTIRIMSDILESNGSSSMATVCAGTLAMMDAGIPISKPVSGIAMGLITDGDRFEVLSDILGDEDHLGDMDFKVTGTKDGITACQMDIKIGGLSYEILEKALMQAKEGRMHILGEMLKTIDTPRAELKPHVPQIKQIKIPKDFIGTVIGPGGKMIQEIQKVTETVVVLEEEGDFGVIDISGTGSESIEKAIKWIKDLTTVPEVGDEYDAVVKSVVAFGAFVEFLPGKQGLVHISEIEHRRLEKVEEVLKEGDALKVKIIGKDAKSGKFKLSRKALIPKPEAQTSES